MLVLCSRSARPQKGLARRAQLNQTWVSFREGETSELGRTIRMTNYLLRKQTE